MQSDYGVLALYPKNLKSNDKPPPPCIDFVTAVIVPGTLVGTFFFLKEEEENTSISYCVNLGTELISEIHQSKVFN